MSVYIVLGIHSVNQVEAREVWSGNCIIPEPSQCLFGSLILSTKVLQGLLLDTFSTTSGFVVLLVCSIG